MSDTATIDEAIIELHYVNESKDQRNLIEACAKTLLNKRGGGGSRKLFARDEWPQEKYNALKKGLRKIHICAHGNQNECGTYNAADLAAFIKGNANLASLKKISIHSCMSAAAGGNHPHGVVFAAQFASELLRIIGGKGGEIQVKGYAGYAFTDANGQNWALTSEQIYSKTNNQLQKQLPGLSVDQNIRNSRTARPVYSLHRPEFEGDHPYVLGNDGGIWIRTAGEGVPQGFVTQEAYDEWAYQ